MDPIVRALAAGSTPEPPFDDQDGDTDDEVAQHTDGASEGEQYDQSNNAGTFTITEYQLLHRGGGEHGEARTDREAWTPS